jgi:hypothetical protein
MSIGQRVSVLRNAKPRTRAHLRQGATLTQRSQLSQGWRSSGPLFFTLPTSAPTWSVKQLKRDDGRDDEDQEDQTFDYDVVNHGGTSCPRHSAMVMRDTPSSEATPRPHSPSSCKVNLQRGEAITGPVGR